MQGISEFFESSPPPPAPTLPAVQDGPPLSLTVALARAGWAEEDDVGALVQEVELGEMQDERLLHGALEAEVELLQRVYGGEARS